MRVRRLLHLASLVLLAQGAEAQTPDATPRVQGATVRGVVRDSIAGGPLPGASVQLVDADRPARWSRTVLSDSMGRFTFADVPDGAYTLGFLHTMLDSLGLEPPMRGLQVRRGRDVRADLAVPSPARLRAAICGTTAQSDSATLGGVLVGIVRDAKTRAPAAGVAVRGEWLEFTLWPKGIDKRQPRLDVTTGANGWFALCQVPTSGTMFLRATRGADSTDLVEVSVPAHGFLRTELYLGASRTVVLGAAAPDSLALPRKVLHLGDERLRGTVKTVVGGRPLAGALVRIADGPQTTTDDQGAWSLAQVPGGTRVLEVRAIGYYPVRQSVDVVGDAPPLELSLITFQSMLDTVRIVASRVADRSAGGFDFRRRSGMGRYITAEQIERRQYYFLSDLFRMVPGVRLEGTGFDRQYLVRSDFGGYCSPSVYVDGLYLWTLSADELDNIVDVRRVTGIEIYAGATTPLEFQQALSGCGAIVIWTK